MNKSHWNLIGKQIEKCMILQFISTWCYLIVLALSQFSYQKITEQFSIYSLCRFGIFL